MLGSSSLGSAALGSFALDNAGAPAAQDITGDALAPSRESCPNGSLTFGAIFLTGTIAPSREAASNGSLVFGAIVITGDAAAPSRTSMPNGSVSVGGLLIVGDAVAPSRESCPNGALVFGPITITGNAIAPSRTSMPNGTVSVGGIPSLNPFLDLQEAITVRLKDNDYLADLPVLTQRHGDLRFKIDEAVGKIGVVLVVVTPLVTAGQPKGDQARRMELTASLSVMITEDVLVNQAEGASGKGALDIGVQTMASLVGWSPGDTWQPFIFEDLALADADPLLVYEAKFATATLVQLNQN